MSYNPTNRRLSVAGPSTEVQWFIERARGRLGPPTRPDSPWRSRPELSFRALSDLLPFHARAGVIPEDIHRVWLRGVLECREGMSRADWGLTDYVWSDDSLLERLLVALSVRYRALCFVTAWEDPDTWQAASTLIWRGRVRKHTIGDTEISHVKEVIYRRYGLPVDEDDSDADYADANDDVDVGLLDFVQRHWDAAVERILRGLRRRS